MSEVNDNSIMTEEDYEKHELDHYEESAKFIKLFHSQFRKMSYKLANRKKRAVVRVLEAMLFEPFEEVQLIGKEEKELFAICHKVMYHKNKVMEYAVKRKQKAELEKENSNE